LDVPSSHRDARSGLPVALLAVLATVAVCGVGVVIWRNARWTRVTALLQVNFPQPASSSSTAVLYTAVELLRSTPVIRDALQAPGVLQLASVSRQGTPEAWLRERLQISVLGNSSVLSLSLENSANEERDDAQILVALIDAFKSASTNPQAPSGSNFDVRVIQPPTIGSR
jgi:hypothetical protein